MLRAVHGDGGVVPGTPRDGLADGVRYLLVLGSLLHCLAGAGEEDGELADGAGGDGAGEPQQRERDPSTGPRPRALIGRRRRRCGRGFGLGGEAAAEE